MTSRRDWKDIAGAGSSCFLSFLASILLFSVAQLGWEFFRSTPWRTILGGALCCLFYSFCLVGVGNLEECLGFQRIAGYAEVVICLVPSLGLAATIHPVCATTCLLFSMFSTWCFHQVAQHVYFKKTRQV
ncbi:hypothetical protein GAYE_HPEPCTG121G0131 [Galdieria yellowstonensis]|uniref:Dolichyl-diphosphooligosaccharide--protein glycosyltransferase subunit KCP2 n=1 Tax=Galdieria yellowstonensis TaxID=3028027 RepID=A0AAV9I2I8_9RHOD|nr:hypothetical protein GAYE_HPEPCTG121G0131 [Galdieria yellowstonensis]